MYSTETKILRSSANYARGRHRHVHLAYTRRVCYLFVVSKTTTFVALLIEKVSNSSARFRLETEIFERRLLLLTFIVDTMSR